jgi:hypothetical protein
MKEINQYNIGCRITDEGYSFGDADDVKEEINVFLSKIHQIITEQKGTDFFPDWTIDFHINYSKYLDATGFYKNGYTRTAYKHKVFELYIPIPDDNQVSWGIPKEYFNGINKNTESKPYFLPVNFNNFDNQKEFIVDCVKRSVIALFERGITIKGEKLKLKIDIIGNAPVIVTVLKKRKVQ